MAADSISPFIAGIVNKLDGDFVVAPKIAAPADLKENLSVFRASAAAFGRLRCWPRSLGLVPSATKSSSRIVGDQAVLAQGLIGGTVDAAYLGLHRSAGWCSARDFALARSRQSRHPLSRSRHRRAQKFSRSVT